MDDGLKQRLVGALVLLALGILFVPVLFEPENRRSVDRTTQIPQAPHMSPVEVAEPQRNELIEEAKPAQDMYQLLPETSDPVADERAAPSTAVAEVNKAKSSQPERKVLDERGVPKAWAVQVASFNTEKRALVLRDQLLEKDYPAFTRTLNTSKGRVTRVYVGPKINRDKASKLKAELDKSLEIDALVVKFSP